MSSPQPLSAADSTGAGRSGRTLLFWGGLTLALLALLVAPRFDPTPRPAALWAACAAIALVAAAYRPVPDASVGLGGLLLVPVGLDLGPAAAAWVIAAAGGGGEVLRRLLITRHRDSPPERRGARRVLVAAVRSGAAALIAALLLPARLSAEPRAVLAVVLALASYVTILLATERAELLLRDGGAIRVLRSPRDLIVPGSWDALGGLGGLLLAPLIGAAGWGPVLPVLGGFGLLGLAAARHFIRARDLGRQVRDLQQVGDLAGIGGRRRADLAQSILEKLREAVSFSYVQLDIVDANSQIESWWATDRGPIERGEVDPGQNVPRLPGFHRRRRWVRLDRQLNAGERQLGRFRLWCDPRRRAKPDFDLLDQLVPQLAALIERATLDREAKVDTLTGIARRQVFAAALEKAWEDCRRRGSVLSVVLLDVDHFKRINDTHGHAAGDLALSHVASLLAQGHRGSDLCCRYGGEEFALLLPDTEGKEALDTAERIRRAVESAPFPFEGRPQRLTVSAGVACFPEVFADTAEELMALADRALYAAKERGRNRSLRAIAEETFESPVGVRFGKEPARRPAPRL